MSGIVALLQRDQRPLDPLHLRSMLEQIAHRGPDGSDLWIHNWVGLGQCLLRTTPESLQEVLPRQEPELQLAIVADARLDNRSELIETLQLQDRPAHSLTDSYLIAAAYRHWGEDSPGHLLGDFAYVIWDLHHQQLFCARDHLGVKPLYLYLTAEVAILGSELQALLAHPQVPRQLNEIWLAGYLAQTPRGSLDLLLNAEDSPYRDVRLLAPGHGLRVGFEQHHHCCYWQLDPHREAYLKTDQEAIEAFREIFSQAVTCRLRSHTPVGIQLSGGLDSSSIACMALDSLSQIPSLHAFTTTFDDFPFPTRRRAEESRYYQAVLQQGPLISHLLPAGQLSPLRDQDQIYIHPDTPFFSLGMGYFRIAYRAAQEHQIRVVLSGAGGDGVVSHGLERLGHLARTGQWLSLTQEISVMRTLQHSPAAALASLVWRHQIKPKVIRGPLRQLWQHWQRLHSPPAPQLLDPTFVQRTGLKERQAAWTSHRRQLSTLRAKHYLSLTHTLQDMLLNLDKTAAKLGIEGRHPFYDKRLVEFCLSLPIEMKLRQGYGRWILRQAMEGVLPPEVQWRHSKADLTPIQVGNFLTLEASLIHSLLLTDPAGALAEYLDPQTQRQLAARSHTLRQRGDYLHPTSVRDATLIWLSVNLRLWLEAER